METKWNIELVILNKEIGKLSSCSLLRVWLYNKTIWASYRKIQMLKLVIEWHQHRPKLRPNVWIETIFISPYHYRAQYGHFNPDRHFDKGGWRRLNDRLQRTVILNQQLLVITKILMLCSKFVFLLARSFKQKIEIVVMFWANGILT